MAHFLAVQSPCAAAALSRFGFLTLSFWSWFRCFCRRSDRRGGCRVQPDAQEYPGWRPSPSEATGLIFLQAALRKTTRRLPCQRPERIGWPGENRNGDGTEQRLPGFPGRHLDQVVRADEPYEGQIRVMALQRADRVDRVARAETTLDIGNPNARMAGDHSRRGHPLLQPGHAFRRLERVLRRDEPPDLVQAEAAQRDNTDMPVPVMGGIEGSAEQPDAAMAPGRRLRCAFVSAGLAQGRSALHRMGLWRSGEEPQPAFR